MAAKSYIKVKASDSEVQSMLSILQEVGKVLQPLDLSACLTGLPEDVKQDKEKITRYLLLVALLDQQAESKSARNTAVNLYQNLRFLPLSEPSSLLQPDARFD